MLESLFLNKVAGLQSCNFIKNEIPAQIFSCEFCEIFKNSKKGFENGQQFSMDNLRPQISLCLTSKDLAILSFLSKGSFPKSVGL